MPKVSIVTPLYNAEKYISQTIESIIAQSFEDWELVIVDDGSSDNSLYIVNEYAQVEKRIKVYANSVNQGIAYTRNRALSYCTGEYVALLDDDDLMTSDRLLKQVKFLDSNSQIGAVGGNALWIDESGNVVREKILLEKNPEKIRMYLCFRNIINNSEMTFRRRIIEQNGISYSDGCLGMEDYKFWIEFSKVSDITMLDEIVLQRRIFDDSETAKVRRKKAKERAQKYNELQLYSLDLSGIKNVPFEICELMKKYWGEDHAICTSFEMLKEYLELPAFFSKQAYLCKLSFADEMILWFNGLINEQNENVVHNTLSTERETERQYFVKRVNELEKYISEVEEGKKWLEGHCSELQKRIDEILDEKQYCDTRIAELEKYIEKILEGKAWLQTHAEDMEKYISEVEEGKKWLEGHCNELEEYVAQLLEQLQSK